MHAMAYLTALLSIPTNQSTINQNTWLQLGMGQNHLLSLAFSIIVVFVLNQTFGFTCIIVCMFLFFFAAGSFPSSGWHAPAM